KLIRRAGELRDTQATAVRPRETPEKFAANPLLAAGTLGTTFAVGCARMESDAPSVSGPERIQIVQVIEYETRAEHWPGGEEQHIRSNERMQILFVTGQRRDCVEQEDQSITPLLGEPDNESAQHSQLNGTDDIDHRAAHTFDEVEVFHDLRC